MSSALKARVAIGLGVAAPFVISGLAFRGLENALDIDLPILAVLAGLLVLRAWNGFAVSVILHRWASHHAFELSPWFRDALRAWAWLWTGLGVRTWASVHRRHHADPDGPEAMFTPLSSQGFRGIGPQTLRAHWRAVQDPAPFERIVPDLPDDALERFIRSEERRLFGVFGIRIWLLIGLHVAAWALVFPWSTAAALAVATLPATAGAVTSGAVWLVNGLGHYWGVRPNDTPDGSTNVVSFDLWLMGEGLHNNHHAQPRAVNFAMRPGELDPSYHLLRLFSLVGWVRLPVERTR